MGPSPSWGTELGRLLRAKETLLERLHKSWLEARICLTAEPTPGPAESALVEADALIEQIRFLDTQIDRIESEARGADSPPAEQQESEQIATLRASIRHRLGELERLHLALDRATVERLTALGKELSSLREGRGAIDSYRPFRTPPGRFDRNA